MERADLAELHYIAPIENLESILTHGLLSNNRIEELGLNHKSVASLKMQARREKKVPGGLPVHDYVNLYINGRNKMFNKVLRTESHESLMVLGVSTDVLDIHDTVISDRNVAASDLYIKFEPSPEGLAMLNRERVFAQYWTHPDDYIEQLRHGSEMCAEVLVPTVVEVEHIETIYVSCAEAQSSVIQAAVESGVAAVIRPYLFFR